MVNDFLVCLLGVYCSIMSEVTFNNTFYEYQEEGISSSVRAVGINRYYSGILFGNWTFNSPTVPLVLDNVSVDSLATAEYSTEGQVTNTELIVVFNGLLDQWPEDFEISTSLGTISADSNTWNITQGSGGFITVSPGANKTSFISDTSSMFNANTEYGVSLSINTFLPDRSNVYIQKKVRRIFKKPGINSKRGVRKVK